MIKNIILLQGFLCLSFTAVFAQASRSNSSSRTHTRINENSKGSYGALSLNHPSAAWRHLPDIMHGNASAAEVNAFIKDRETGSTEARETDTNFYSTK
jgi:hypothetical protein